MLFLYYAFYYFLSLIIAPHKMYNFQPGTQVDCILLAHIYIKFSNKLVFDYYFYN